MRCSRRTALALGGVVGTTGKRSASVKFPKKPSCAGVPEGATAALIGRAGYGSGVAGGWQSFVWEAGSHLYGRALASLRLADPVGVFVAFPRWRVVRTQIQDLRYAEQISNMIIPYSVGSTWAHV